MSNIRPLTSELQKIANEELNEVENRIPEDLQHIKVWLEKQHYLNARTENQWLIAFLRGCKYSLEKTKAKLDFYYSIRTVSPEYYKNRYPFSAALNDIFKTSSFTILPQSASSPKSTVFLSRWDICNTENCSLIDLLKYYFMVLDILLMEDDNAVVSGIEIVADYSQFTLSYALQFTPALLKKLLLLMENAYPIRIKGIYLINTPPVFESIHSVAKRFMSDKLNNRVIVYSSEHIDELYKRIPKQIMPKEYGGDNASVHKLAANFSKKMESYGQWLLDDEKYGSDEALRPSNMRRMDDILGVEGSFRKLNVD